MAPAAPLERARSETFVDEQPDPDRIEEPGPDAHAVLEEIGTQGAVASLESRLIELESELERAEARAAEAERARRGELTLMRARIEDALSLVADSMREQREEHAQLEQRLSRMVDEIDRQGREERAALRDALQPEVHRAVLSVEETAAALRGELEQLQVTVTRSITALGHEIAEERFASARRAEQLDTRLQEAQDAQAQQAQERQASLEGTIAGATAQLREEVEAADARVEALRRELDGTAGELRAGANLRANELSDRLDGLEAVLAEREEADAASSAELHRRWSEGLQGIARRLETVDRSTRDALQQERAARTGTSGELALRASELESAIEDIRARLATEQARRAGDLDRVRDRAAGIDERVEALHTRVGEAVTEVAGQLGTRVSGVTAELEALRELVVRQRERLATVDALHHRLDEMATAPAPAQAPDLEPLQTAVQSGQARIRQMEEGLAELHRQLASLRAEQAEPATPPQDETLRREVRELASRTAEIAHRLDETERLARAAGRAIASAVRRARGPATEPASAQPPGAPSPPPQP